MKPGVAFPDFISTEKVKRSRFSDGDSPKSSMRVYLLLVCIILFPGLLLFKLIGLQLVEGNYYRLLSDSNRIRTTIVHAPRGVIFDRQGKPLVYNMPGFRIKEDNKTVQLTSGQALPLLAKGKQVEVDSLRQYPQASHLAHVLGYIGQITEEELKQPAFSTYRIDDIVGKMGIEQSYESVLRGVDGKQLSEVDATGKIVRKLGQTDPTPGENITLSIDSKLHDAAYAGLKDIKKGAVIVSTPKGELLALVSKPSFDPNLFTLGKHYSPTGETAYKTISEILLDGDNQPLLNRAITGVYPPGSTFKLITAVAGLEDKKIDAQYEIEDTGILRVGEFSFANWYYLQYGGKEGSVNVVKAIKRSNDIFFYHLAGLLGVEKISLFAKQYGLGQQVGIDIFGEAKGLVPSPDWKKEIIGEGWYLGDTYHYGIGQGYVLTTPLQVNIWTQGIANGGIVYKPHLLKDAQPEILKKNVLIKKNLELIRQGMIESCSPTGVAWPLFEFKVKNEKLKIDGKNILEVKQSTMSASFKDYRQITVACKTGTAQHGGEKDLPHAWITLWAPAYNPEIIVTVLAESSGEGSSIAGPVAKRVLESWFTK